MTGLINRPIGAVTFHFRHVAKLPNSRGADGLDARASARDSSTNNKNRFGKTRREDALWGFT
jgi:predicted P-loop ATPase